MQCPRDQVGPKREGFQFISGEIRDFEYFDILRIAWISKGVKGILWSLRDVRLR